MLADPLRNVRLRSNSALPERAIPGELKMLILAKIHLRRHAHGDDQFDQSHGRLHPIEFKKMPSSRRSSLITMPSTAVSPARRLSLPAMLRPLGRIFPAYYRFRHKIRDAKLEADRATVNAALDRIEQERQGRRISSAMRSRSPTSRRRRCWGRCCSHPRSSTRCA
jgi:hypothetical protein